MIQARKALLTIRTLTCPRTGQEKKKSDMLEPFIGAKIEKELKSLLSLEEFLKKC